MFFGKALYGTFTRLVVFASSSEFQSHIYKTKKQNKKYQQDSNILASPKTARESDGDAVHQAPYVQRLRHFPASLEDKYRDKMKKIYLCSYLRSPPDVTDEIFELNCAFKRYTLIVVFFKIKLVF